nr:peptidoglycan bridge formation glycyltransferase FemA/FemB family protein [uncultured Carboxylicivirga sp.]
MIDNYQYYWTQSEKDIEDWDFFLQRTPRGHCQQSGHWLKSFQSYPGFKFELLIVKNKGGNIVAGLGILIVGIPFFKVLIASNGPIIENGYEELFDNIVEKFLEKAKNNRAFYSQIQVPVLEESNDFIDASTLKINEYNIFSNALTGSKFPFVTSINGFRPVVIQNTEDSYNDTIRQFNKSTRRNIRLALDNKLTLKYATDKKEVEVAYRIIEEVAQLHQYRLRSWDKIKDTLLKMVDQSLCLVPCCYVGEEMKGALIIFDFGCRLTYVFGGVKREDTDRKVGHFLHDQMIRLSIEKNYSFYDLGVAGGPGVTRFKEGFGAYHITTEGSRYWVMNKFKYKIYLFFYSLLLKFN